MLVIMKRPGKVATLGELTDFRSMREYVCGQIDFVSFCTSDGSPYLIVFNDNFLNDGSEFNISFCGAQYFGNIFICKCGIVNGDADFIGLDPSDVFNIADNLCWSRDDKISLIGLGVEASRGNLGGEKDV